MCDFAVGVYWLIGVLLLVLVCCCLLWFLFFSFYCLVLCFGFFVCFWLLFLVFCAVAVVFLVFFFFVFSWWLGFLLCLLWCCFFGDSCCCWWLFGCAFAVWFCGCVFHGGGVLLPGFAVFGLALSFLAGFVCLCSGGCVGLCWCVLRLVRFVVEVGSSVWVLLVWGFAVWGLFWRLWLVCVGVFV